MRGHAGCLERFCIQPDDRRKEMDAYFRMRLLGQAPQLDMLEINSRFPEISFNNLGAELPFVFLLLLPFFIVLNDLNVINTGF